MDFELLKDIAEFNEASVEKRRQAMGKATMDIARILEQLENEHGEQEVRAVLSDLGVIK